MNVNTKRILTPQDKGYLFVKINELNSSLFTHSLVLNLCTNSSVENGLFFSNDCFEVLKLVKQFNYKNICNHPRILKFKKYATLIIETIFEQLMEYYPNLRAKIEKDRILYPKLITVFEGWLTKYSDYNLAEKENRNCKNKVMGFLPSHYVFKTTCHFFSNVFYLLLSSSNSL